MPKTLLTSRPNKTQHMQLFGPYASPYPIEIESENQTTACQDDLIAYSSFPLFQRGNAYRSCLGSQGMVFQGGPLKLKTAYPLFMTYFS